MHSRQAARKESNRVNLRKSIQYSECCCSLHSNAIPKTKAAINVNLTTTENVSGQSKYRIKVNEKLQLRNGKKIYSGSGNEKQEISKKLPTEIFIISCLCNFVPLSVSCNACQKELAVYKRETVRSTGVILHNTLLDYAIKHGLQNTIIFLYYNLQYTDRGGCVKCILS